LEKITVKVPTMGDAITEGTVVEWVKSVGDPVAVDDVVALVETDKVREVLLGVFVCGTACYGWTTVTILFLNHPLNFIIGYG